MTINRKVLIVENSQSLSAIYSSYLIIDNYSVQMAHSLTEARLKWKNFQPDFVFLDIELGDGNGLDLLSEISDHENRAAVFVITGYGSDEHAAEAIRLGAKGYITKPIDPLSLGTVLL